MSNFIQRTGSFASSATKSASYDAGLRDYMVKVYNLMSIATAISGAVAFLVASSPALMSLFFGTPLAWVVMLAPLGFVFFFMRQIAVVDTQKAKSFLWIYSALMGLSLSFIFVAYTSASIARVFFVTAVAFGATSLYGYSTKKDLTSMGSFLIMGVIGLLVASVVNLFLMSSALQFGLSVVGVLIFTGFTAYHVQNIKQNYYQFSGRGDMVERAAIIGALNLYTDFINLFISLLHLLGDRRGN